MRQCAASPKGAAQRQTRTALAGKCLRKLEEGGHDRALQRLAVLVEGWGHAETLK